jgi:hypothetical protein
MLRFTDPGGRGYNTIGTSQANLLAWWTGTSTGAPSFTIFSGGRNGGNCLRITTVVAAARVSRTLDVQATWGIAFAINPHAVAGSNQLFALLDGSSIQCDLRMNIDGTLTVTRNGTALGSTSAALPMNVWTHVEWKTLIGSAGTSQVRINGATPAAISYTGNTQATGNSSANVIQLGNNVGTPSVTIDFDDVVIYDGQANDPQNNADINDFIGDCAVSWLLPTAIGTNNQWTPSTGLAVDGNNYDRVNDPTPPGDSNYVESSTTNAIDSYAIADLPTAAANIKSVQLMHYAKKTDAGSRSMAGVIRTGSTDYLGPTLSLPSSYTYNITGTWGKNPSGTPAAWTKANIDGLEIGQKQLT